MSSFHDEIRVHLRVQFECLLLIIDPGKPVRAVRTQMRRRRM